MGQDRHVTSEAILAAGRYLEEHAATDVAAIRDGIDGTTIPFPGFGLAGLGFQIAHSRVQTYARNYLQAAHDQLISFNQRLTEIADAWRRAEDANQVQVR